MPKASVATRRSGVITSWEKYGGIAPSRPLTCAWVSLARLAGALPAGVTAACWVNRSGSEKAGHSRACPQPRVGAVAEALQHRALVGAHPFDRRRLGQRPCELTIRSISPPTPVVRSSAFRPSQRAEVLRHELGDVGLDLRLRVEAPAERREREADAEHAAGPAHRADERGARDRARERVLAQQLAGVAPGRRRPRPTRLPYGRAAAGAARRARRARRLARRTPRARARPRRRSARTAKATTTPTTSSSPKPRTIGTGESTSTSIAAALAAPAVAIVGRAERRRAAHARLGRRRRRARCSCSRRATGTGSRSRRRARRAPAARRSRPSSATRPRATARRTSARPRAARRASGSSRGRPVKTSPSVAAITSSTAISSSSIECGDRVRQVGRRSPARR